MQKALLLLAVSILIPIGFESAFAQTTHTINIPTGAASPDAPYFWQVEDTGNTKGIVTIRVNDSVSWGNADTAAHTVTSGTPEEGPDGIFDSGLYGPGKFFKHQFTEVGTFPYYCIVHPWMVGEVRVLDVDQSKKLQNVASGLDKTGIGFEVSYILDVELEKNVRVDAERKTLTFSVIGQTESDELVIRLPHELIQEPVSVWVDDNQVPDFIKEEHSDYTLLTIPIQPNSKEIEIMGTNVIPEFGSIVYAILAISIISVIALSSKFKLLGMPKV